MQKSGVPSRTDKVSIEAPLIHASERIIYLFIISTASPIVAVDPHHGECRSPTLPEPVPVPSARDAGPGEHCVGVALSVLLWMRRRSGTLALGRLEADIGEDRYR